MAWSSESDKNLEQITEQLKEITKQLSYKEMYENERKRCSEVEDKLREQYKQNADVFKQLLVYTISNQNELLNKESMQSIFEELKKEAAENLIKKSEDAQKKEILDKGNFTDQEYLQQKALTEKLKEEIAQLKYQLAAHEKQWEGHTNSYEELNKIYEKRINDAIASFDKQLKDSEEAYKKEFHKLQLKLEEFKREEDKKLKDCKESHRKEINSLQLKFDELEKNKVNKSKDSEGVQQ